MTSTEHFDLSADSLNPQPWMQLRQVADARTDAVARTYGASGGQNKDEVLQTLSATWTNNTPTIQYVYGLVHQGGCAVSLQARSRGYLRVSHSLSSGRQPRADPLSGLVEVSRFGGGADMGVGGILGIGTDFGIHEVRSHSTSVPLMPHITGWLAVSPGHTVTAGVEVRFVSEKWEDTNITNGKENTDCTVLAGELAMDLFAVPVIDIPPTRTTPVITDSAWARETGRPVTVGRPVAIDPGDVMIAVVGNNFGNPADQTAPAGWSLIHAVNTNTLDWFNAHVKVFAKLATASEPMTYTFPNGFGSEQVVHLIGLRGAVMPGVGADSNGWSIGSTRTRWSKTGNLFTAPSMATNGQLLIASTFFALTDDLFDGTQGTVPVTIAPPAGMTPVGLGHVYGGSSSMACAALPGPPNPTGERSFTTSPRAYYYGDAVTLAILVSGTPQFG